MKSFLRSFPLKKAIFLCLLILCLHGISLDSVAQTLQQTLDTRLSELLDSAAIPGMSLTVIKKGEITYSKNLGVKVVGKTEEISEHTIFEAASLTKPIAAFCAMKLVEEGKLDLDKPLVDYLPYADIADDKRSQIITARMVLSHQTGLPNWRADRQSKELKFKSDPNKKFGYSGEGFVYLQKVLEKIEGKNLGEIASEMIFKPLGMQDSFLVFPDSANFAVGHNTKSEPQGKGKPNMPNAAYSMHTTSADYARFLLELMNPTLIEKYLVAQMENQEVLMDSKDPSLGWGLGLGINTTRQGKYLWHWGDNGVFRAFFIFSEKDKTGFVYFTNSQNGLSIVHRMMHTVFSDPEIMENWKEYKQL
ncbi:beta-lactamase family protein [Algoriphagus aestuarii]|nr:beta-lactamase family protein [Algoriphagus aestuarii]